MHLLRPDRGRIKMDETTHYITMKVTLMHLWLGGTSRILNFPNPKALPMFCIFDRFYFTVNELHPQLLDNDRYLLFHLQQQHLIELIRQQKVEDALQYAAEHLAERGEEDGGVLQELERTLALLAFEDPASSPFSDLLQPSHRQQVNHILFTFKVDYES